MKKGFTLIELLAVIVIIAMLMVLTYSEFSKELKTAKQKAYERQVVTIQNAAKDYHLSHINDLGVNLTTLCSEGVLNCSDLKDPRNSELMTGCVLFVTNSYGQTDYQYQSDLASCDF